MWEITKIEAVKVYYNGLQTPTKYPYYFAYLIDLSLHLLSFLWRNSPTRAKAVSFFDVSRSHTLTHYSQ